MRHKSDQNAQKYKARCDPTFGNFHLREVGVPSRNILHGRGVGSKSRIRVTGPGGSLGAFDSQNTYRNFSLESFFLGPRMRDVYRNFVFRGSTN